MPSTELPPNASTELGPEETYTPVISDEQGVHEISWRAVIFGIAMIALFSAAATYICLKFGQGIEAALPISVLAIGYSRLCRRRSTLLENVMILAIGSTSGIIVGGSVFVMPAIFMLDLQSDSQVMTFLQICLVPILGAILGALVIIPFRRYFTHDMHGKLPFPEATAATEILLTGEEQGAGSRVKTLIYGGLLGFGLDLIAIGTKIWGGAFTTDLVSRLDTLSHKTKAVFSMNTSAAVLGLGVIIGPKFAFLIMAGSTLSYFVLIPLAAYLSPLYAAQSVEAIFYGFPGADGADIPGIYNIGIGAIFGAGIIAIVGMSGVILQALKNVLSQVFKRPGSQVSTSRMDQDIPMTQILVIGAAVSLILFLYFRFVVLAGESNPTLIAFLALVLTLVVVVLFAAVSAWAVAMIGITPVSGMTLTTLIIGAILLASMGLSGASGKLSILLIGGVVCSALVMCACLTTQFKIGYWLGSTPSRIQWANIISVVVASIMVTAVMMIFAHTYGFGPETEEFPNALKAPQASAMAAVAEAFLGGQNVPWLFYGLGVVVAVVCRMMGVPAIAIALGMYLPMELNSPILAGACLGWVIQNWRSKSEEIAKARKDKVILMASGLLAGGAIAGVFDGMLKMFGVHTELLIIQDYLRNWTGLAVFATLALFIYTYSRRVKTTAE